PVRGDDDYHRQNRQPADRRSRVQFAADAGRLRARHTAVLPDADHEHRRPLHRPEIPGAVRMTDISMDTLAAGVARQPRRDIGIKRRYAAGRRFRLYGILAISFGILFLGIMLVTIIGKGYTAFWQTTVTLPINFEEKVIDPG